MADTNTRSVCSDTCFGVNRQYLSINVVRRNLELVLASIDDISISAWSDASRTLVPASINDVSKSAWSDATWIWPCTQCTLAAMSRRSTQLVVGSLLIFASCISRGVNVPPFIPPTSDASLADLIVIINQRRDVQSLTARVELQFETAEGVEEGRLRQFRSAQGRIFLARPENIRLQIEAPVLGLNLAEMASDGSSFQLLIYPEEYRALIVGSNDREYVEQTRKMENDPELKKAGPLVNIRPQHFTSAFLFDAIDLEDPNIIAVMEEARRLVPDDRPEAKRGDMVVKSYYVLSVIRRGESSPRHQYWFDRGGHLELVGLKSFDTRGALIGDVTFSDYFLTGPAGHTIQLPAETYITRPYDRYALRLVMSPETVELNRDLPEAAFFVETAKEWGDSVRRIDLDRNGQ